jgi:hypothetical protein
MRRIHFIAIAALALVPSLAFALTPYKTEGCEVLKNSDIRCLLNDSKVPTATIDLKNKTGSAVSFTVDEWHSRCGFSGGKVESNSFDLSGGATRRIDPQAPGTDKLGFQITCREVFITGCKEGAKSVNCKDAIEAKYTLWVGNKQ